MALIIPYTFVAGTKAKAAEVNANFQAVAQEVNAQSGIITSVQSTVTNIQNNKAEVNGNSSNRFSVATPINSYDAVNKIYFTDLTKYLLVGLQLSRGGDNTISCSKGATYDTTYSKILKFDSNVSRQNTNQAANATYYVYIEGSSDGTSTNLLISTSASNPALESGYTLYQYLGYYTTDSSKKIKQIYENAPINGIQLGTMPHIKKLYVSGTSGYIIYSNGVGEQWGRNTSAVDVTLPLEYKNTSYNIQYSRSDETTTYENGGLKNVTTTGFTINTYWPNGKNLYWRTIGELKES